MHIEIKVTSNVGNTASTGIKTTTLDPVKEGSKALLRLVRLLQNQEKTNSHSITITGMANKIKVIKLLREQTGKGLKDAKDVVESGGPLVSKLTADEVQVWTKSLDEIGATYHVKCG